MATLAAAVSPVRMQYFYSASLNFGTRVMVNNFQRLGAISNTNVGSEFETVAQAWFFSKGVRLQRNYGVEIGFYNKKERKFDLGSNGPPVLVECKSHKWTASGNVPSAKITVWNESMYYFLLAPPGFRKVLFVVRDFSQKRGESLAEYYVRNHSHLIPDDVEILEYDASTVTVAVSHAARLRHTEQQRCGPNCDDPKGMSWADPNRQIRPDRELIAVPPRLRKSANDPFGDVRRRIIAVGKQFQAGQLNQHDS